MEEEIKLVIPCDAKDMENRKLMFQNRKLKRNEEMENYVRLINLENPKDEEKEEIKRIEQLRRLKCLIKRINYWLKRSKYNKFSDDHHDEYIDLDLYDKDDLNKVFDSLKEQGFKIITEGLDNQADITW